MVFESQEYVFGIAASQSLRRSGRGWLDARTCSITTVSKNTKLTIEKLFVH